MADRVPIPLAPRPVPLDSPLLQEICSWSFDEQFVSWLLRNDIPQRVTFGRARIWAYTDPSNTVVGFGTLDLCTDYSYLTNNQPHLLIPLLAVNPAAQGRGHGNSIVQHLIAESALFVSTGACNENLFLDVYVTSTKAIALYERNGFKKLIDEPIYDDVEAKDYFVMARRVSLA